MTNRASVEALVPKFVYEKTLNQDQAGRRTALQGTIDGQPALIVLERAPFPTAPEYAEGVAVGLDNVRNLGANDVYFWFMGTEGSSQGAPAESRENLKINLIYPCTPQHIRKYSRQGMRFVTETAAIYRDQVRPYMQAQRDAGRLNWVYNIIEGKKEVEDVIYRTPFDAATLNKEGFLMIPDLNWDRKTLEGLHLLAIVERRDLWSLRDLKRKDIPWLRHMREQLIKSTLQMYTDLEADQLKLYVHYQPTYYHFHIHIVHVQLEAGATQATGKAVGLESIIEQLEHMAGGDDAGMDTVALSYTLGEASELWQTVYKK